MTSLYQLSADYQRLLLKDEYDHADMEALVALPGLIEDKIVNCACLINELEGKLLATKEAIKIAQDKAKRLDNNIERIKQYVLDTMIVNTIEKIDKHPLFDVTLRHNPVSVHDYDPQAIPLEYFIKKEVLSLDKKRIKDDIENLGLVIPGANLVRKMSLRIG